MNEKRLENYSEEALEAVELLVKKSGDLTNIAHKIMDRYYEIK